GKASTQNRVPGSRTKSRPSVFSTEAEAVATVDMSVPSLARVGVFGVSAVGHRLFPVLASTGQTEEGVVQGGVHHPKVRDRDVVTRQQLDHRDRKSVV